MGSIRTGATLIVATEGYASLSVFHDEVVANDVQLHLKNIDTELQARRINLYRQALGDGSFGLTD